MKDLVKKWFDCWTNGDYTNLPISDGFTHTSPFGTIEGKQAYLDLVANNTDKFLGQTFVIHDAIYQDNKACVRYTAQQGEHFSLDVSEWYYCSDSLIEKIIAHYHIGDIRDERAIEEYPS